MDSLQLQRMENSDPDCSVFPPSTESFPFTCDPTGLQNSLGGSDPEDCQAGRLEAKPVVSCTRLSELVAFC